jgi:sarcosine oxidase
VIGCSTAYHLAKRGASVLVVERRAVAAEQSSKSWGFCRQQGRDLRELPLMVESVAAWAGLEEELGWDVGWQQGGNLALHTDEAQRAAQASWAQAAQQYGVRTELLDRSQVAELLPGLGADHPVQGGMWTATDGTADPAKATAVYAQAAVSRGACFLQGCGVRALSTAGECLPASKLPTCTATKPNRLWLQWFIRGGDWGLAAGCWARVREARARDGAGGARERRGAGQR